MAHRRRTLSRLAERLSGLEAIRFACLAVF
jgi:hypothetical protein